MDNGVDELIEHVRSRRKLPSASERRRIREAAGVSLRDVGAALGVVTPLLSSGRTARPRKSSATPTRGCSMSSSA
jgi:hypothetical protein